MKNGRVPFPFKTDSNIGLFTRSGFDAKNKMGYLKHTITPIYLNLTSCTLAERKKKTSTVLKLIFVSRPLVN